MQLELKQLQKELGVTLIFVTHDQEEAMTMSDRIAVMNQGHYEQIGDPEQLYERPRTRFVAGFLGVSNLLQGRADGSDDGYAQVRLANDARVRVRRELVDGKSEVEVGVRPEKIRLAAADAERSRGNVLTGTVRDASYMGVSTQYIVELESGERVTIYEQNVDRTVHGSLHRPGEQVQLAWSPDHTFVVDPGAGAQAAAVPEESPAEAGSKA
jgi:spermidine/putrescine transport system ATP-binding protein